MDRTFRSCSGCVVLQASPYPRPHTSRCDAAEAVAVVAAAALVAAAATAVAVMVVVAAAAAVALAHLLLAGAVCSIHVQHRALAEH